MRVAMEPLSVFKKQNVSPDVGTLLKVHGEMGLKDECGAGGWVVLLRHPCPYVVCPRLLTSFPLAPSLRGRAEVQLFGSLPPMWEPWLALLPHRHPWLLATLGKWPCGWDLLKIKMLGQRHSSLG